MAVDIITGAIKPTTGTTPTVKSGVVRDTILPKTETPEVKSGEVIFRELQLSGAIPQDAIYESYDEVEDKINYHIVVSGQEQFDRLKESGDIPSDAEFVSYDELTGELKYSIPANSQTTEDTTSVTSNTEDTTSVTSNPVFIKTINNGKDTPYNLYKSNGKRLVYISPTQEYINESDYLLLEPTDQSHLLSVGSVVFNDEIKIKQAKFESENVKLSNGDYVSKVEYDKLTPYEQSKINELGVTEFNNQLDSIYEYEASTWKPNFNSDENGGNPYAGMPQAYAYRVMQGFIPTMEIPLPPYFGAATGTGQVFSIVGTPVNTAELQTTQPEVIQSVSNNVRLDDGTTVDKESYYLLDKESQEYLKTNGVEAFNKLQLERTNKQIDTVNRLRAYGIVDSNNNIDILKATQNNLSDDLYSLGITTEQVRNAIFFGQTLKTMPKELQDAYTNSGMNGLQKVLEDNYKQIYDGSWVAKDAIEVAPLKWVNESEWNKLTPEQQTEYIDTGSYTITPKSGEEALNSLKEDGKVDNNAVLVNYDSDNGSVEYINIKEINSPIYKDGFLSGEAVTLPEDYNKFINHYAWELNDGTIIADFKDIRLNQSNIKNYLLLYENKNGAINAIKFDNQSEMMNYNEQVRSGNYGEIGNFIKKISTQENIDAFNFASVTSMIGAPIIAATSLLPKSIQGGLVTLDIASAGLFGYETYKDISNNQPYTKIISDIGFTVLPLISIGSLIRMAASNPINKLDKSNIVLRDVAIKQSDGSTAIVRVIEPKGGFASYTEDVITKDGIVLPSKWVEIQPNIKYETTTDLSLVGGSSKPAANTWTVSPYGEGKYVSFTVDDFNKAAESLKITPMEYAKLLGLSNPPTTSSIIWVEGNDILNYKIAGRLVLTDEEAQAIMNSQSVRNQLINSISQWGKRYNVSIPEKSNVYVPPTGEDIPPIKSAGTIMGGQNEAPPTFTPTDSSGIALKPIVGSVGSGTAKTYELNKPLAPYGETLEGGSLYPIILDIPVAIKYNPKIRTISNIVSPSTIPNIINTTNLLSYIKSNMVSEGATQQEIDIVEFNILQAILQNVELKQVALQNNINLEMLPTAEIDNITSIQQNVQSEIKLANSIQSQIEQINLTGINTNNITDLNNSLMNSIEQIQNLQQQIETKLQSTTNQITTTAKINEEPYNRINKQRNILPIMALNLPTESIDASTVKWDAGTVCWRQGYYWELLPPPYDKLYHSKTIPKGAYKFATGTGSAKATLQVLGGKPPSDISADLGFVNIYITSKDGTMRMNFEKESKEETEAERIEKIPRVKKQTLEYHTNSNGRIIIDKNNTNNIKKVYNNTNKNKNKTTESVIIPKKQLKQPLIKDIYYLGNKLRPTNLGINL